MSRAQKILEMALQHELIFEDSVTRTSAVNTDGNISFYTIIKNDFLLTENALSDSDTTPLLNNVQRPDATIESEDPNHENVSTNIENKSKIEEEPLKKEEK